MFLLTRCYLCPVYYTTDKKNSFVMNFQIPLEYSENKNEKEVVK